MVISFSCPNGHRLTCPDDQAGHAAQCPECGATIEIPAHNLISPAGEGNQPDGDEVPSDEIEFLCPNGHRLHSPAQLAGRAGQCPHCGTRFRVPTLEDVFEAEETSVAEAVAEGGVPTSERDDGALDIPPDIADEDSDEYLEVPEDIVADRRLTADSGSANYRRAADMHDLHDTELDELETHSACTLFSRLWDRYSGDAVIEVELSSGEKFVPARFAPDLSRKTHGLFTITDADGTHTLIAVAWDSVARFSIRGIRQLPEGWFN